MGKFARVLLAICISLIVLLGVAVFFLFNAIKSVTNNPNLVQNASTTVVSSQTQQTTTANQNANSQQEVTTSQNANSQQETTVSNMESTTTVSESQTSAQTTINQDQAINTALSHAGLTAGNGTFTHAQLDQFDDNIPQAHYDVEIISNGYEYDYKIDATNGNVISNVKEIHD